MITAKLGEHARFLSGFAFKSSLFNSDGIGLPVVRIRDVLKGRSNTYFSGEYDEKFLVQDGDYLIGMDGQFNLGVWKSGPALLNQRVCKVDYVSNDLDIRFLARILPLVLKKIEDDTPFVTVKHLSVKKLNESIIPLPPVSEQKRIAAILDAADALRAKRRETLAQLDTLLQSTFLEMFGDPVTNPKGWELCPLTDIADLENGDRSNAYPSGSDLVDEGVLFLSTKNIVDNHLIFDDCQFITRVKFDSLSRGKLQRYDLVITLRGTLGSCAVFDCQFDTGFINAQLLIIRPRRVKSLYLQALLSSKPMRRHLERSATGVAVKQLTSKKVGALSIPLPPPDLQNHFATIVQSVEQQKSRLRAHLDELDTLFASLQARAFAGEL